MAHLFAKAGLEGQRVQARVHDVNPGGLSLRVNVPVEQNGSTEHFELPLFIPAKVMSKQVPGRIEPNEAGTQLRWENRQGEDLVYKAATFIEVDIDHIDRHHGEIFALPTDLKQAAAERAPQDGGERGGRRGAHRDSGSSGARRRKAI
jgi:hypothetical protein